MRHSPPNYKILFFVGLILGAGLVGAATVFSNDGVYSGHGYVSASPSGPEVGLPDDGGVWNDDAARVSDTELRIETRDAGNATFISQGKTSVRADQLVGTWTNLSEIDANGNTLTIDPGDKSQIAVGAGMTAIDVRALGGGAGETGVDDGEVDFIYSADSSATLNVTTDATQGETYGLVNADTRSAFAVTTAESGGKLSFDNLPQANQQEVLIQKLGTLTIREETPPHAKITTVDATIKFFEDEEDDPVIIERTASNGEVELTGVPVDEQFVVQVQASGYYNRTVILDDIGKQETVFLLDRAEQTVENRFVVADRTGDFPPEDSELIIQRSINRSVYGGSPSGFSWTNVAGDDLGADEAFVTTLEEEGRYRILVRNDEGDTRILGAYTAETTGTITLNIGSVVVDPESPDTVGTNATLNQTAQPSYVRFGYNDSTDSTSTIYLRIHEYQNESNILLANTTYTGTYGVFTYTKTVPNDRNETDWVVDFVAKRSGHNTVTGELVVGPRRDTPLSAMPDWLIAFFFCGVILTTGGIMSQRNGPIGAVVMSGLAGMFWFVGLVPDALGIGVIVLAMLTGAALVIRERGAGGL